MTDTRPRPLAALAASLVVATVVGACALFPLNVDRAARAPVLPGFGGSGMAITTASAEARRGFAQGMEQAYAFNETEAVRAFKAALAQDPSCAMCAWGVAFQLGPNINDTSRGELTEARRYIAYAMGLSAPLPERDRALIEAMAVRYGQAVDVRDAAAAAVAAVAAAPICSAGGGGGIGEKADPLDIAYAARLRELADRWPGDADVVSFYAEAEMIATREDAWWDRATGKPAGRIGEVARRLEEALKQHPDHVGLNHYLIHAVDAQAVAGRAEASADRLGRLAPASPHLLHMPSHTYLHLGRWADASRVNEQALAADDVLDAEVARQGFATTKDWRGHDGQFLWYAALMEGRGELALKAARDAAARAKGDSEFAEFVRARPLLTLLRLERWAEALKEPVPRGSKGMAALLGGYVHGVALARSGQLPTAAVALAEFEPAAARLVAAHPSDGYIDTVVRGLALVARQRLRAEVALAEGRGDAAVAEQRQAIELGKDIDETEPPMLAAGTRIALGDMQLQTKHWADAEQTFQTDLAAHPRSGWARRGLVRALQAQGRGPEAEALKAALARDWSTADPALLAQN